MIHRYLIGLAVAAVLAGCATTPPVPLPDRVSRIDPSASCECEPQAGTWDVRAQLTEDGERAYLAVYLDSPFDTIREPQIKTTGIAIYKGKSGKTYFYDLGQITRSRTVGTLFIEDPSKSRVGSEVMYQAFKMERREGSDCLRLDDRGMHRGALGIP